MKCISCGANFDDKEAKCPFCGSMNETGAKMHFYNKLTGITDSIEDMSTKPKKVFKKKFAATISIVAVCIILGIVIVFSVRRKNQQHEEAEELQYEKEQMELLTWENENFPKCDEWYEQKNFRAIIDYYYQLIHEGSEYNIYRWRHYEFLDIYKCYDYILKYIEQEEQNVNWDLDKDFVLEKAMQLVYYYSEEQLATMIPRNPENSNWGLTVEELEWIDEYKEEAKLFMTDSLGVSDEEQKELNIQCQETNYVDACFDYAKRMGW